MKRLATAFAIVLPRLIFLLLIVGFVVGSPRGFELLRAEAGFPSANGKIAFVRDGGIWAMNPDGTAQTRLTSGPDHWPAWAPDGTRIAFARGDGLERDIYVMNADGTAQTNLTHESGDEIMPTWSPDGQRIAFTRFNVSLNPVEVTSGIGIVNADGSGEILVANTDSALLPDWSPDGSTIAFVLFKNIWLMRPDGTDQRRLTGGPYLESPDWAPDGSRLAVASFPAMSIPGLRDIYVVNVDGSGLAKLTDTENNEDPTWSADGSKIAFVSRRDGNREIYVMNADGTGQTNLTNDPEDDLDPAWQPLPTPGPEDRKVIFIQGIDSESGECGEDFVERVQWMVDYLVNDSWVRERVPSLDSSEDFFYFSYRGLEGYCNDDLHQPQYNQLNTCDGVGDGATKLNDLVTALILEHPDVKFDIVAHSMGGMVAAEWLWAYPDVRPRVNSVVTFDSPLRGVPDKAPKGGSLCDTSSSLSWNDLWCQKWDQIPEKCASSVVPTIAEVGESTPFFTIDATQRDFLGFEYVPGNRTTLLSSSSKLHCGFDDDHSSVWDRKETSGDEVPCWLNETNPEDPPDYRLKPLDDAKGAFVACAITHPSDPDTCISKLGTLQNSVTALAAPAEAGQTAIDPASTIGFAVGDFIRLNPGGENEEENEVVGFASILLASPLQFDHQAGEPVVKLSAPPSMVAGWNQACYLGAEQPIDQALADITGDVLAVYRLNSSQTFDRWFPGRPDVSTIATITPYQPLFVLMVDDASWAQSPTETPPASASLVQGWNNVCYAGKTRSADDATAGMAGNFSILYRLGSDRTWSRFVPARPEVSSITELNTYDSVLILVSAVGGAQWVFDP